MTECQPTVELVVLDRPSIESDLFERLGEDHRMLVCHATRAAEAAAVGDPIAARAAMASLRDALWLHARSEERVLHRELAGARAIDAALLRAAEEHALSAELVDQLLARGVPDPSRLRILCSLLDHHASSAETALFRQARATLGPDQAFDLAGPFVELRAELARPPRGRRRARSRRLAQLRIATR
jgi:hypothetical protein